MNGNTARDLKIWSMVLDDACRTIVDHLRSAGQPFLMLKGVTIASWLYDDPSTRTYEDLDVLIPPGDVHKVVPLMGEIGYRPLLDAAALQVISPEEQPLQNDLGVTIDLHVAIKGIGAPPHRAWEVLEERSVAWDWRGFAVPALDPAGRAMHLALHLPQRGLLDTKAAKDLELGLVKLDSTTWRNAAELADQLDALQAFTAGLLLVDAGSETVDRLRLPRPSDAAVLMSADGSVSRPAVALERILSSGSWRQRLATGWAYLFPTTDWLRHSDARAGAGGWELAWARVRRPFRVLARAAAAFRERAHFQRRHRR